MANKTERVTVRLPYGQIEKVNKLVEAGKYKNRSCAFECAIGNFIEDSDENSNAEKVIVTLTKNEAGDLDYLVREGEILDRQDGIRAALRDYTAKMPFKRRK